MQTFMWTAKCQTLIDTMGLSFVQKTTGHSCISVTLVPLAVSSGKITHADAQGRRQGFVTESCFWH